MPENQLNQASVVVTTLLHYNVTIRDTLEYCLNKPSYDVELFKNKKRAVLIEVDQNTPTSILPSISPSFQSIPRSLP